MSNWEYRRIIIVNKSLGKLRFVDSVGGTKSLNSIGFVRTPQHAATITDYLAEVSKDGWEIVTHAVTHGLLEEVVTLRRAAI